MCSFGKILNSAAQPVVLDTLTGVKGLGFVLFLCPEISRPKEHVVLAFAQEEKARREAEREEHGRLHHTHLWHQYPGQQTPVRRDFGQGRTTSRRDTALLHGFNASLVFKARLDNFCSVEFPFH